jgi:erythromycin esterase-like protein
MKLSCSCEKEAIDVLKQMLQCHAKTMAAEAKGHDGDVDESFYAMENAKIVREAEKYYRHMFEGGEITWNIRDTHMCDCLQDLLKHNGPETKAVIWVILFDDVELK